MKKYDLKKLIYPKGLYVYLILLLVRFDIDFAPAASGRRSPHTFDWNFLFLKLLKKDYFRPPLEEAFPKITP
jgi:hypothetical protein